MRRLVVLVGLVMALAIVLPASTEATSFSEVVKLIASDAEASDFFGDSVAFSGDTAVVGAWGEDTGGSSSGAAYVFHRDEGGLDNWGGVTKLMASDAEAADDFGWSVAASGDTVVVGANFEDAGGINAGAAYVFERDEGGTDNWGEVTKLIASDAGPGAFFGYSVAASDDTVVVGAYREGAGGTDAGAAYIFRRSQGSVDNWGEVTKLTAPDAGPGAFFGYSVAVSDGTVVVGAYRESAEGTDAGAAYVFERRRGGTGNWGEVTKLTASDAEPHDRFGDGVAVSGDTAVVGASAEDAGGPNAGAAYVFERDQGGVDNWGEATKLTASDAQIFDRFGGSVALSGNTMIVGAWQKDAGFTSAGAVYVFQRDHGGMDNWSEVTKLIASDAQASDRFGDSVALSGETAVVGAFWKDGVGADAGAAYLFDLPDAKFTPAVSTGDANCDQLVNAIDAALVLQFNAALLSSLPCAGDANRDGEVTSIDAALILQFVAGLLGSLPP